MTLAQLEAQKGQVDRDALLGRLLWFVVPEATMLDYGETVRELGVLGLTKHLPKAPYEYDIFARVTRKAERRRMQHTDGNGNVVPGQFENWMVRDVAGRSEDVITRRIVCEVVDPSGKKLDYEQVVDLEYHKPKLPQVKGRLDYHFLPGHTAQRFPVALDIVNGIKTEYARWQGQLGEAAVRSWITKTITSWGAIPARPTGGIYFLQERFADQVEVLETFVASHLPSPGECHSVELLDTAKQREMVHKAIEHETIGAIEDITAEVQACRREGKLTPKKYVEIQRRVAAVERKNADYMKMLSADRGAIKARLDLLAGVASELEPLQKRITRNRKKKAGQTDEGTEGQDRESYTDDQDRESYTVPDDEPEPAPTSTLPSSMSHFLEQ